MGKLGNYKHGFRHKQVYAAWSHMKQRCDNVKDKDNKYYGGRGISYDPRWKNFKNFLIDMGEPKPGETLDRIDNDGSYCKSNCRWASRAEQSRNRKYCQNLTYNGETKTIAEWACSLGMSEQGLKRRLDLGWSVEKTLSTPKQGKLLDHDAVFFNSISEENYSWQIIY